MAEVQNKRLGYRSPSPRASGAEGCPGAQANRDQLQRGSAGSNIIVGFSGFPIQPHGVPPSVGISSAEYFPLSIYFPAAPRSPARGGFMSAVANMYGGPSAEEVRKREAARAAYVADLNQQAGRPGSPLQPARGFRSNPPRRAAHVAHLNQQAGRPGFPLQPARGFRSNPPGVSADSPGVCAPNPPGGLFNRVWDASATNHRSRAKPLEFALEPLRPHPTPSGFGIVHAFQCHLPAPNAIALAANAPASAPASALASAHPQYTCECAC